MGRFKFLPYSFNNNINYENFKVFQLQIERHNLIEALLYQDSINKLLQLWQDIIRKMACEAIPKKIGIQWLTSWNSQLELSLNNYQCSGI